MTPQEAEERDHLIEGLRFIQAVFEGESAGGFHVTKDLADTLANYAIGVMRAAAIKDGWTEPEDIHAYIGRLIDGQLGDLMMQEPWSGDGPAT